MTTLTIVAQNDRALDSLKAMLTQTDTSLLSLPLIDQIIDEYKNRYQRDSFMYYCERGKELSKIHQNLSWEGMFLLEEAEYYKSIDNVQEALACYSKALNLYEKLQEDSIITNIHKDLTFYYALINDDERMEQHKTIVENYYLLHDKPNGLSDLYRRVGIVKAENGHAEGIDFLLKALTLVDTTTTNYYSLINNIAYAYNRVGKSELALLYRHKQLDVLKRLDDFEERAYRLFTTKTTIAYTYLKLDNYEKALQYFQDNINAIDHLKPFDYQHLGSCYNGIGDIHTNSGNIDEAIKAYKQAIQAGERFEKNEVLIYGRLALAKLYTLENSAESSSKAIQLCKAALISMKLFPFVIPYEIEVHQYLYQNYEILGEYKNAFKHYKNYSELRENNDTHKVTQSLDSLSSIVHMQSQLAEDRQTLATKQDRLDNTKRRISFSIFGIILLSLLFVLIYNRRHRKILECKNEELHQLNNALKISNEIKNNFMSSMNHQLRTPMNSIVGFTALLRDMVTAEQKIIVQDIQYASAHLMKLLKNMLNLWELQQSKVRLQQKPFNIEYTLHTFTKQYKANYNNEQVKLTYRRSGDLLQNRLIGDYPQLEQILSCLLDNALKFTEQGTVELHAHIRYLEAQKVAILFEVIDTGCGIEKERLPFIFESFSEIANVKEQQFGGTGLGLSIAKALVELHGGTLEVNSTVHEGSCFFFELIYPLDIRKNLTAEEALQGKQILLVEDNKLNQKLAQKLLEYKGMHVVTADNGAIGLEMLKSQDFDLILMDLNMPIMNGFEATQHIRKLKPPKKNIPIIVLSANLDESVKKQLSALNINAYMNKPFRANDLVALLQDALYIG